MTPGPVLVLNIVLPGSRTSDITWWQVAQVPVSPGSWVAVKTKPAEPPGEPSPEKRSRTQKSVPAPACTLVCHSSAISEWQKMQLWPTAGTS